MARFCTSCGKQLNPKARFCTKCGTPVDSESAAQPPIYKAPSQQAHTPSGQSYIPSYSPAQQQSHTGPYAPSAQRNLHTGSGSSGSGATILCIVLAIVLFLQTVIVALFGWPGFLAGGKTGRKGSFTKEPDQAFAETKISEGLDFDTYKAINSKTLWL